MKKIFDCTKKIPAALSAPAFLGMDMDGFKRGRGVIGRFVIGDGGSALLIAMIMLVVITVIGAATMNTSTTEVIISGNYRTMKESFYNTERVIEYAIKRDQIYANIGDVVGGSAAIPLAVDNAPSPVLGINIFSDVLAANVSLVRESSVPRGLAKGQQVQNSSARAFFYRIDVTARGPANAESHQIVEKWRPKSE